MAFPSSPVNGQQATVNNTIYQYSTAKSAWVRVNPSISSLVVTGNANVGNIISSGFFWSNGNPFTSSNYGDTNVAAYLTGNITAGNVSATGYYFANGTPFISGSGSSTYGNANVAAYLPNYSGNITANNITANGTITGGGIRNYVGNTTPTNPTVGDTWFDTDGGVLLRYVNDGTTSAWIDTNGLAVGATSNFGNAQVAAYIVNNTLHPFLLMGA